MNTLQAIRSRSCFQAVQYSNLKQTCLYSLISSMFPLVPDTWILVIVVSFLFSYVSSMPLFLFLFLIVIITLYLDIQGSRIISPLFLALLYSLLPMAHLALFLIAILFTALGRYFSKFSVPWTKIIAIEGLALLLLVSYYAKSVLRKVFPRSLWLLTLEIA